ncbi:MAG: ROK family protein [Clostridia bacterium]|nr:ROK family protein [Clostridia bacterium]
MKQEFLIGVDIGGTKIASGLVDQVTGELITQLQYETPKTGNDSILSCVGSSIQKLLEQTEKLVSGIGIGIAGSVNRAEGIALSAGNLNFRKMPVSEYIWNRFQLQSFLENDTNAGTLGEKWFGQGEGLRDFVYIALGTGIGGGLVFDGKLYVGKGHAGEIGHMIVDPGGGACVCGLSGCIESLASGTAIARQALERLQKGEPSSLQELFKLRQPVTAKEVFNAAELGDSLALEVVEGAGHYLACTLTTLINLLDPEVIIFSGSVSRSRKLLLESILQAAPFPRMREYFTQVLRFSQWTTGIIGAASVVLDRRSME